MMFTDRIEAKWIDTFEKAFELCKVTKGEEIAIERFCDNDMCEIDFNPVDVEEIPEA